MSAFVVQPTSPFPFAPLDSDAVEVMERGQVDLIGLYALEGALVPADVLQQYADLLRSSDVRCGYQRARWAS